MQVFNYAPDNDAGLTTLSGTTPVTLSNLPGAGGANTYGEFATGTFVATSTNETFNWNGAGSSYTVVGAISVRKLPITPSLSPTKPWCQGHRGHVVRGCAAGSDRLPVADRQRRRRCKLERSFWREQNQLCLNTTDFAAGNYEYQVVITAAV